MSELHVIIWTVKQESELQTASYQIKIFHKILTLFSYFHVLTHFLCSFSIRMKIIVENDIIPLIYSQLQTVDIAQILTALSNSMLVIPALLPEREPLGSHLSAQRKTNKNLSNGLEQKLTQTDP